MATAEEAAEGKEGGNPLERQEQGWGGGGRRRQQPVFINFLLGCSRCHSSEIMEPLHTLLNNSICEESKCVSEHSYAS